MEHQMLYSYDIGRQIKIFWLWVSRISVQANLFTSMNFNILKVG